jgi:hypothetical protein
MMELECVGCFCVRCYRSPACDDGSAIRNSDSLCTFDGQGRRHKIAVPGVATQSFYFCKPRYECGLDRRPFGRRQFRQRHGVLRTKPIDPCDMTGRIHLRPGEQSAGSRSRRISDKRMKLFSAVDDSSITDKEVCPPMLR